VLGVDPYSTADSGIYKTAPRRTLDDMRRLSEKIKRDRVYESDQKRRWLSCVAAAASNDWQLKTRRRGFVAAGGKQACQFFISMPWRCWRLRDDRL
jgi:hypothetical protein